ASPAAARGSGSGSARRRPPLSPAGGGSGRGRGGRRGVRRRRTCGALSGALLVKGAGASVIWGGRRQRPTRERSARARILASVPMIAAKLRASRANSAGQVPGVGPVGDNVTTGGG